LGFHKFAQWLGRATNVTFQVRDVSSNTFLARGSLGLAAPSRGILYEAGLAHNGPHQAPQPRAGIIHTIVKRVLVVDQLPVRVVAEALIPMTDMAFDLGNPTRTQERQRNLDTGTKHQVLARQFSQPYRERALTFQDPL